MNVSRKGLAVVAALAIALITGCTLPRPPRRLAAALPRPGLHATSPSPATSSTAAPRHATAIRSTSSSTSTSRPATPQTQRPALVWVHGGGFCGGDKTNFVPVDVANTFAKLGYVVVSINYRLLGPGCIGEPGSDCTAAAYRRPARRPGGGALAARQRGHLQDRPEPDRHRRRVRRRRSPPRWSACTPRTPARAATPASRRRSAASCRSRAGCRTASSRAPDDAAGVFFHGTADGTVSPQWSVQTSLAMLNAGVPAWLQLQKGAGHVPWVQYRELYLAAGGLLPVPGARPGARQRPAGRGGAGRAAAATANGEAEPAGRADAQPLPNRGRARP